MLQDAQAAGQLLQPMAEAQAGLQDVVPSATGASSAAEPSQLAVAQAAAHRHLALQVRNKPLLPAHLA